jgi:hypothetical protein
MVATRRISSFASNGRLYGQMENGHGMGRKSFRFGMARKPGRKTELWQFGEMSNNTRGRLQKVLADIFSVHFTRSHYPRLPPGWPFPNSVAPCAPASIAASWSLPLGREGIAVRSGVTGVIWLAGLALAACAGEAIKKGMTALQGQPLSAAITKLGVPTEERTIAGQKVYIWFTRTVDEGTEYKCQIRAIMAGNVIGSFDFEGNEGKCRRYAAMLQ